jgi:hypothetical protein
MRIFVLFIIGLMSFNGFSETSFPKKCKPVRVQGNSVVVDVKKGNLLFIHSTAKNDLWLTHPVNNPSASAGWTSRIQPDHWSALALDKSSFEITCIESRPGHEQQTPCEGMIAVCQWKKIKIPEGGTFWAGEDRALSALIAALGGRGINVPAQ